MTTKLSVKRLNELCGGAPTTKLSCPMWGCSRAVGPYYSEAIAKQALKTHLKWVHFSHHLDREDRDLPENQKPKTVVRARRFRVS